MVHGTNKHTKKSRFSVKHIKITTKKRVTSSKGITIDLQASASSWAFKKDGKKFFLQYLRVKL